MRLLRVDFQSTDAEGHPNRYEAIAGRLYFRFLDIDLDAAGQARCNRIVAQSALARADLVKALHTQQIDVAELVSYGPYTGEELFLARQHEQDIRNAEQYDTP